MLVRPELTEEKEPPSIATLDEARAAALVERVCAVAHLPPSAHVAVIGHRTLPLLLEFLRRGCCAVRSLRPGSPAPDCESADLAWIVDVRDGELEEALRAARSRAGRAGRVVIEGMACGGAAGLPAIRECAIAHGLDVVSFDHLASRLVLASVGRPALAA
jgi:hypothetical protein